MNRRGKLLLILDGFDEMARQVDYQTVVDNFWELANLVEDSSKVILTSRTEYFRWAKETEKVLSGQEYGRRTIVLQPPRFEVLHLDPFTNKQIRIVIERRVGGTEGKAVADSILANQNLAEMARKPVLIELLLAALDEVSADVLENQAEVYLYATNALLLRNITEQKTFTSTADKLFFLCELAWEMIKSGELRIHYTTIPDRIRTYFGDRIKDQHELDTWDYDLRSQTLLHRDAAGYYEFAHKSLAEYFVAFKFAAELGCLAPKFAQTYTEANGGLCEIPIEQKDTFGLADTFGAMKLTDERMQAVHTLLHGVISERDHERLWKIIYDTRNGTADHILYVGGNALSLLQYKLKNMENLDLSNTNLRGALLNEVDLSKANLQNTILQEVSMTKCIFKESDLRNSNMLDIEITEPSLFSMDWNTNSNKIAAGDNDGNVWLWNTDVWHIEEVINIFDNYYPADCVVCFDKIGETISIGSFIHEISLKIYNIKEYIFSEARLPTEGVYDIIISHNGEYLAICCSGNIIKIFNTSTMTELTEINSGNKQHIYKADFNYEDTNIACVDNEYTISIWSISPAKKLYSFTFPEEENDKDIRNIPVIRFSFAENIILFGCWNGDVIFWDITKNEQIYKVRMGNMIRDIRFGADNRVAISDSTGNIKIIDFHSHKEINLIGHSSEVFSISWNGDCSRLASCGYDGVIYIWDTKIESATFGKILRILHSTHYTGAQISNALGLERDALRLIEGTNTTLLEFLADRGAILDEEQQRTLAELRRKRTEEQRKAAEKAAEAERPKRTRTQRKRPADGK